ncbi:PRD domain protein [Enterococcus faecalis 13-SD-W-01]|nr:PRD domain protein [Enterococcus faecalis 13-SD-W-01]
MLLTQRETLILNELLEHTEPVSLVHMMDLLKVSKRTVYRELANLETSLQSFDTSIVKSGRGKFKLSADTAVQEKLKKLAAQNLSKEFAVQERQHAILIEMLLAMRPISAEYFMAAYQISQTTFFSDLKQLEEKISRLSLSIVRNRGYIIEGSEKARRLLIANLFVSEVNEYHFFHRDKYSEQEQVFFRFLDHEHFLFAQQLIQERSEPEFADLSDRKLVFIITILTLAMDRVEAGVSLEEESYPLAVNKELLKVSKKIFYVIGKETRQLYSIKEITFFAVLMGNLANSFDRDFFEENFDPDLAYRVKRMIEEVSEEAEVAFYEDAKLYKLLLTHISGVLARAVFEETVLRNPILEKIMEQYTEIASSIQRTLPKVFPEQTFSQEEVAYMVLHFANSLEKHPKVMEINIAGISPSGLASLHLLEIQLRKHFPFINEINFFRVGDIHRLNIEENYDLVVSTALLPGYTGKYKLVSPMLLTDEIRELKESFKTISQKKRTIQKKEAAAADYVETLGFLEEINQLLALLSVQTIQNPPDLSETLHKVMSFFENELVCEKEIVAEKLLQRSYQAPIGIPETQFALFHASSKEILRPVFRVFDLVQSFEMLAMDKQPITVKRLLVMLAPAPLDENTSRILGKISSSIIMNDLNTEIFNSGNQQILYQLLSSLLIEEVKK